MAYVKMQKMFDLDRTFTLKTVENAIISSTTTATGTPWIPMSKSFHITFIGQAIDATLAGIITMYIFQAVDVSGGGTPKVVTGKTTAWVTGTPSAGTIKILDISSPQKFSGQPVHPCPVSAVRGHEYHNHRRVLSQ